MPSPKAVAHGGEVDLFENTVLFLNNIFTNFLKIKKLDQFLFYLFRQISKSVFANPNPSLHL